MAPKRKSSTTALGTSFYQHHGASSSKKRLVFDEEPDYGGVPLSRTSTNMSTNTNPVLRTQSHARIQHLTSPSLENITTNFDNLRAASSTASTTPITPHSANTTHHTIVPPPPQTKPQPVQIGRPKTYLVVGASRGIGLELTRQLLLASHQVIAVVRDPSTASQLWQMTGNLPNIRPGSCVMEQCDVGNSSDISAFVSRMRLFIERGGNIDVVILNAGILDYETPGGLGALGVEFEALERHLRINCVGNIVLARKLLQLNDSPSIIETRQQQHLEEQYRTGGFREDDVVVGRQTVFMSSDSGSMADFREYEDGFAAYGASKVALNMMIRHMAAELRRQGGKKDEEMKVDWQSGGRGREKAWESEVCVLAMHPGEVSTDMANIELGWEVEGVITAEESVSDILKVLQNKKPVDSGTFWRWDGTEHSW